MRGTDASDNNQETIDCLDSACAFMQSAISRAMDYSLISGGVGLIPSNTSFNLFIALNNPIKWMGTMIAADGRIKILLNPLPEGIENIISDRHWVEENLLCLLSNAVKYSNRGTISISVTLKNKNIRVTVADMGIGISAESKPLLFKQFSKLQNMASGSTGLGLFSLLKRSEAIDGSCGVDDRSDGTQGSAFWFEFPYVVSKENSSIHVPRLCLSTRGSTGNSFPARPSLTVLIVDDSPMIIKFLTKTLLRMGHRVISACNGADGLEKMIEKKNKIDLVIMDLQMPVMDGIEATRRYRELESMDRTRNRLCIVCSSANSHIGTEALAVAAGVDSFLPKPFDITKFSSLIASMHINER
jgi:CheY-like chemotaxis protein